ncbi:phage tail protein I [Aliarcobacter cryaerophilus]|uniref:Phage tail protein I n=2 Tax=unclassified Arcobacter TaxID=2593671 RepID=A0AA96D6A7_9BACT|nr:phage tail protein I [Arcobacter sp. AZ-2023]WPD10340.1 phage tail protein I [Arcobacter sp. DSM 115954]WNL15170.1 phage tail protein I [Arcobacter sp. AZ-2023]WNL18948.1 phage tail protein I [Arcobacter sp. AZ-2023]WNL21087.1 phage tail protein I [Arcobacter sp. AZ-2023]
MGSISLLPQSEDSKLKAIDLAYETRVAKLKQELQVISTLAQPKRANEEFLPYLAHTYQVVFWSDELTSDEERELIDLSILLHRKKGTIFALKEAFKKINMDIKISEWFDYGGLPYHFKIDIDLLNRPVTQKQLNLIEDFIEIYKNEKSILELGKIRAKTQIKSRYAGACMNTDIIKIYPAHSKKMNVEISSKYLSTTMQREKIKIYEESYDDKFTI